MVRERRDFNRLSGIRDPSLIVIATEGEQTEQQLFCRTKGKCVNNSSRVDMLTQYLFLMQTTYIQT